MVITLAEFAIGFVYGALLEGFWNGPCCSGTNGCRLAELSNMKLEERPDSSGPGKHRPETCKSSSNRP